jgi:hypothetical protein
MSAGVGFNALPVLTGSYNRTRRHSTIGYISPIEMELKAA